jgi:hypothetical protein
VFNEVLDEHLVNCTCIFLIGQLAEKDNLFIRQKVEFKGNACLLFTIVCYLKAVKPVAAPGFRIGGGGHLRGKLIFGGGQDIIFKKVLLFAHAVVTGLLSPPQEIRPPLKRGRYS